MEHDPSRASMCLSQTSNQHQERRRPWNRCRKKKRFWTSLWTVLHAVISLWVWVPAPTSAAHRQKWQMELSWSMARQWGELEGLVLRVLEILESRSVDAFPSWGLDMVNNMSILGEQQGKQNVRMFASVLTRAYMCGCVCLRVLHRVVESAKQADAAPCAHRCHGSCCPPFYSSVVIAKRVGSSSVWKSPKL